MESSRGVPVAIASLQARFVAGGVRFVAGRVFGLRVEVGGRELVPPGEPVIVAGAPHRNWPDGFLLLIALPAEPRLVFLVSENAFKRGWRRALLRLVGGLEPVSASSALNREALTAALAILARAERLGIFPEGWDHLDGSVRDVGAFRRGVAFLAQASGRRVLPVALAGSKPLWRGRTLRVRIGSPLDPPPATAGKTEQQAWSEGLRAALQALLPPEPIEIPAAQREWTWLTDLFN